MSLPPDSRTRQFIEVMIMGGLVLAIHLVSFVMASIWMGIVSRGYLVLTCFIVPLTVSTFAMFVVRLRSWHWGQVGFVVLLTLLMSFLQFLIIGAA